MCEVKNIKIFIILLSVNHTVLVNLMTTIFRVREWVNSLDYLLTLMVSQQAFQVFQLNIFSRQNIVKVKSFFFVSFYSKIYTRGAEKFPAQPTFQNLTKWLQNLDFFLLRASWLDQNFSLLPYTNLETLNFPYSKLW